MALFDETESQPAQVEPRRWTGLPYWGALAVVAVLIFLQALRVPPPPLTGLDPSWQLALTEASVHGMRYGRDIIFTFGPFGYLGMGAVTAASYPAVEAYSLAVALCFALLAVLCLREELPMGQKILFALGLFVTLSAGYTIEILFPLIVLAWTLPVFRSGRAAPAAALLLGLASGFIGLMKFNFAITAGVGGVVLFGCAAVLALRQGDRSKLAPLGSFVAGFVVTYAAPLAIHDYGWATTVAIVIVVLRAASLPWVGGRLSLPLSLVLGTAGVLALALSPSCRLFTEGAIQIASGYSAAMALDGIWWQLPFAFCVLAILALIVVGNLRAVTLPVAAALAIATFLAFKEGFVRQDGHVIFFFWAAFAVAVVVVRLSVSGRMFFAGAVGLLVVLFSLEVVSSSEQSVLLTAATFRFDLLSDDLNRLKNSWHAPGDEDGAFVSGLAPDRFPDAVRAEVGTHTAEALPSETSAIFANGFLWQPDPIFQAYSAYNSDLDRLNAAHLETDGADFIFYEWGAIDGRYTLWDQAEANRAVLCNYRLSERFPDPVSTQSQREMLLLSRVPSSRCGVPVLGPERPFAWNQEIPVPAASGLTFAHISVPFSLPGRMLTTFYRAPAVHVHVGGDSGLNASFRILTGTSADGVLIDPLPIDLGDFQTALRNGRLPRVRSLSLQTDAPYYFSSGMTIQFETVPYR